MTLRKKLFVTIFISTFLIILSFFVITSKWIAKYNFEISLENAKNLASLVAREAEDLVLTNDMISLNNFFNRVFEANNTITYIFITVDKEVFLDTFEGGVPSKLLEIENNPKSAQSISIIPIENENGSRFHHITKKLLILKNASLHIGLSEEIVRENLVPLRRLMAIVGGCLLFLLPFGIAHLLAYIISKPIHKLCEGVKKISQGNLNYQIYIKTGDEIQQLADGFNEMALQLQESYASLEKKVINRTKNLNDEIKKRLQIEKTLREEKDFTRTIIESVDALIIGIDLHYRITVFNQKAEKVLGYSKSEMVGKNFFKVFYPEGEESDIFQMVQTIKENKNIIPADTSIVTKKGKKRIIFSRGAPLRNADGKLIGVLGLGTDVTELRAKQKQTIEIEKLSSLSEVAEGVAHNFNNLLAVILGRTQLLKMFVDSLPNTDESKKAITELKEGLAIIECSSKDGNKLVRKLNSFVSKKRKEGLPTINIIEIIEDAINFTKTKWKDAVELKGITFRVGTDFSIAPDISGNKSDLKEIFVNLLHNAVDAMPHGGQITITIYRESNFVVIKVEDTGFGISRTIKNKTFQPFFTTKGPQSPGLGLSSAFGLIKRQEGTIALDSTVGKGATVTIKLPVNSERHKVYKLRKENNDEISKINILIIEYEEHVHSALMPVLKKNGHTVKLASNEKQGIELFKNVAFDLVIANLEMFGWEIAEKIKTINGRVPVAIITDMNENISKSEQEEKWIDLILHKPFKENEILAFVEKSITLRNRFKAA